MLPPDSASASSSLYCAENAAETTADEWISTDSLPCDDALTDLIASENRHALQRDYLTRLRDLGPNSDAVAARHDSVSWIVKVHAFHRFSPVTAFLSVIFFDSFLSSHSLPLSGWPFQLLSVACLSLAAKMEEPRVPLLLDLQVCGPKFVFEPKTVQRMELRVMAILDWRLRAVTPFDFLHYFVSKLTSSSLSRIFSASSDLILSTTPVTDFIGFAPSTIAAAAVLSAAKKISGDCFDTTSFHEKINKEMVRSCHQLMEEHLIATCPSTRQKGRPRADPVPPPSPVGVLDAAAASTVCGSCDTRSEPPSSGRPEPTPSKRLRYSAPDVQ